MFPNITYWNCGSGLIGKWQIIKDHILTNKCDAFFLAEADIKSGQQLQVFDIQGYNFAQANTIIKGKCRLACWFRPDLFKRRLDLEQQNNDLITLEFKNCIITGIYRPFKCFTGETLRSNFDRLMSNLQTIASTCQKVLFIGDLNVNWSHGAANP